jgi:Na+-driven multidrug efflux pump
MLLMAIGIYFGAAGVMRIFTTDAEVTRVGVEYLRIVVLNFVASGITFVSSSMFQALGNTMPSLATSGLRLIISVIPAIFLARVPGFHLTWIWYLSAVSVFLQMAANLMLLQREFRLKLPESSAAPVAVAG